MRTRIVSIVAVVGLGAGFWQCGGTSSTGGGADASTDGASGDGSGGDAASVDASGDGAATDTGGGDDSSATCSPACGMGRLCCNGQCINPDNDPTNCGTCGTHCMGATPYCDGTCKPTPCSAGGTACDGGTTCCGTTCCGAGDICCKSEGPVSGPPVCFTPTAQDKTCPVGCSPQCVSDRDAKRDVTPVAGRDVLDALAGVPMSTWSYKSDDPSVRHLGPMAQDLHAAFGLGGTDRAYDPIDAHGVAFASIQALYAMVQEQNARIERLEKENERLRRASKQVH